MVIFLIFHESFQLRGKKRDPIGSLYFLFSYFAFCVKHAVVGVSVVESVGTGEHEILRVNDVVNASSAAGQYAV